jgi:hypothetical protein
MFALPPGKKYVLRILLFNFTLVAVTYNGATKVNTNGQLAISVGDLLIVISISKSLKSC